MKSIKLKAKSLGLSTENGKLTTENRFRFLFSVQLELGLQPKQKLATNCNLLSGAKAPVPLIFAL